jgi:hypothetical protein
MTTLKRDVHLTQLMELIEVITIMSCLALFTDAIWCLHDMVTGHGFTIGMMLIFISLTTAFIITFLALCRYHKIGVKRVLKERLEQKLKVNKKCAKHRIETKQKGA